MGRLRPLVTDARRLYAIVEAYPKPVFGALGPIGIVMYWQSVLPSAGMGLLVVGAVGYGLLGTDGEETTESK